MPHFMKWILKVVMQKILSFFPNGENLNYFLQSKIIKSYPISKKSFFGKFHRVIAHYEFFIKYAQNKNVSQNIFYEFGVGQDLIVPLSFYALGIENQTVIDASKIVRLELIEDTFKKLSEYKKELEEVSKKSLRTNFLSIKNNPNPMEYLLKNFGVEYKAPLDAKNTKLPSEYFDFISSTDVLEHVNQKDIVPILIECKRILKGNGVMSLTIDLRDHYSIFDKKISPFNFLKFSDMTWGAINSYLHYQNRLRYSDYINFIKESGFEILEEKLEFFSNQELEELKRIRLAARFKKHSADDLKIKYLNVAVKKNAK